MASILQFPFTRTYYPGIDNPFYIQDVEVANQGMQDGIIAITGMTNTDFAIISGLNYVLGTPNSYTAGTFFLNGVIYAMQSTFNEGLYLTGVITPTLSEPFDDTVSRTIYTENLAASTSTSTGNSPLFSGNMNAYRIGLKYFQGIIASLQTTQSALGSTAFTNLGTGTGQVLTADQTYTQAQVNALLLTRAPSTIGSMVEIYDVLGTFAANFNGAGVGIIYPWYNSATGETWALTNGTAVVGSLTAPNFAGIVTIGQGVNGSNTYNSKIPYGANTYTLAATDIPELQTNNVFSASSGGTNAAYQKSNTSNTQGSENVNQGTPNNPISLMQSSIAIYKVIRLA